MRIDRETPTLCVIPGRAIASDWVDQDYRPDLPSITEGQMENKGT